MLEYRVLSQSDEWFGGQMDPQRLEEVLNAHAQEGWHVVSAVTQSFTGLLTGNRDELLIILERARED